MRSVNLTSESLHEKCSSALIYWFTDRRL